MYTTTLILHSWLRWIVLGLAIAAAVGAWMGWLGNKDWPEGQKKKVNLFFVIGMDVQLLLGLVLYIFLSPFTQEAFGDFGAAMKDRGLRFWAVEHFALMVLAVIFTHLGQALSKRAATAAARYKRAAIFFTLALLAMVAAIPWAGMEQIGRPLFRLAGG